MRLPVAVEPVVVSTVKVCDRACGRPLERHGSRWDSTCWHCRMLDHVRDYPLAGDADHLARVGIRLDTAEAAVLEQRAAARPTPTPEPADVPRPRDPNLLRAARLVLNEGVSFDKAADECGITKDSVRKGIWRYYEEQPDRRRVYKPDEFRRLVNGIGHDDGATVEQLAHGLDLGVVVVTLKTGQRQRYASLEHYAATRRAITVGQRRGATIAGAARTARASGTGATPAGGTTAAVPTGTDATDAPDNDSPADLLAATEIPTNGGPNDVAEADGGRSGEAETHTSVPAPDPASTDPTPDTPQAAAEPDPHRPAAAAGAQANAASPPRTWRRVYDDEVELESDYRDAFNRATREIGLLRQERDDLLDTVAELQARLDHECAQLVAETEARQDAEHALAAIPAARPDGVLVGALDAIIVVCQTCTTADGLRIAQAVAEAALRRGGLEAAA